MFGLKEQIFELIKSATLCINDRERWLGPEVAELGLKHNGLDDIPLDSVLVLAGLFAFGSADHDIILKRTEVDPKRLGDYIDVLSEYDLIKEDHDSGEYDLTQKGNNSCSDICKKAVVRKRFELKRELEHIEQIQSRMAEL